MNTIEHLRELFGYNDWANGRIITALKNSPCAQAQRILAHILITEGEYFERLYGKDSTGFEFWQKLSLEECGKLARLNAENYERLLQNLDDEGLEEIAKYKTSEGIAHRNTFREVLTHILFHSINHRGQVNSAIRDDGIAPPSTDYIIYLRETG